MDQMLSDAKRLIQRLSIHDNMVDIIIGETTSLQQQLTIMRQYHDEVKKMNEMADHRPRSTLVLGSQLENQRIQTLEQENRELSISLAEHQSALDLIMKKYREQVLYMMKTEGNQRIALENSNQQSAEVQMQEKISEMANVMRQSAFIDERVATKEIEALRSLQVENENLRELLKISGSKVKIELDDESFDSNCSASSYLNLNKSFEYLGSSPALVVESKDSGICNGDDTATLSHEPIIKSNWPKNLYDSLENINIVSDKATKDLRSHLEEDATPINNFHGIITDIKPLVNSNSDISVDISQYDAEKDDSSNTYPFDDNDDPTNNDLKKNNHLSNGCLTPIPTRNEKATYPDILETLDSILLGEEDFIDDEDV